MTLNSTTNTAHHAGSSVLIPATLQSRGSTAKNVPVVAGLCLPKGRLSQPQAGYVEGFAVATRAQFEVLNRWNDGTVRWMLTSFIAPEADGHGRELAVVCTGDTGSGNAKVSDHSVPDRLTTIKLVNGEICVISRDLDTDPPIEHTLRLSPRLFDAGGDERSLVFDGIREEVSGEVRQVFLASARLQSIPTVTLQFRLTHWVSVGLLQVEVRIRNAQRARHAGGLWDLGDAGSFLMRSFEISVHSDELPANSMIHWKAERTLEPRSTSSEVFLQQFGSGDRFWNSPNHRTAAGAAAAHARGYEATSETGVLRGYRAEPLVLVEGDASSLGMAIPEFWQNCPSSIGAAMGTLEFGMFPALPDVIHELQGGEQKTHSFWLSMSQQPSTLDSLAWVYDAPRLLQSPVSIASAGVLPWFTSSPNIFSTERAQDERPSDAQSSSTIHTENGSAADRLAAYLLTATSGKFSLAARRARIDEYGWRNFGDIPADHEQTHYAGSNTIVSHYNNQFDMIFGAILQLSSTSDIRWFDWLDPLARHVMDIDIYHTSADRAAFNGGLFWHTDHYVDARTCTHRTYSRHNQKPGQPYGGGPSCEHNYTTGLLHYHFLTGNCEARESVLSLADWVIQMDDGRKTIFGLFDDGPTGAASATVFEDFHGPGRGAGNSVNALLDAWVLTGSEHYLLKAEDLIRRCVHPSQNPGELHLLDAEGHWSYTVFLNSLGRYLLAKRDAELFDDMYCYARDVMKTYGRWMAVHERRTLDHPEQLQYPTEAWAAHDFRKANVLRIAASCADDAAQAATMREKADQINDAAWRDFAAFGEASATARCLSIVMTEGHRDVFHRTQDSELIPPCSAKWNIGPWSMFVPQKQRVKRMLKSPAGLIKACLHALHVNRIIDTWKAARSQL